jgi:hypothetical protein
MPEGAATDLVAREVATLFVLNDRGRIARVNDPPESPGPRMYLAGCRAGNIVRVRDDVSDETATAIAELAEREPPLCDPDSTPVHLDTYVELLARVAPVEQQVAGLTFCVPKGFTYAHDKTIVRSGTPDGDRVIERIAAQGMPPELAELGYIELWAPWCVAMDGDTIASVVETVRHSREGAEAGVTTIPRLRQRGYAAAATAGWARHPALGRRTRFYSTRSANLASRRVANHLGLRFVGASMEIT